MLDAFYNAPYLEEHLCLGLVCYAWNCYFGKLPVRSENCENCAKTGNLGLMHALQVLSPRFSVRVTKSPTRKCLRACRIDQTSPLSFFLKRWPACYQFVAHYRHWTAIWPATVKSPRFLQPSPKNPPCNIRVLGTCPGACPCKKWWQSPSIQVGICICKLLPFICSRCWRDCQLLWPLWGPL